MQEAIDAIYESGVFRPMKPPGILEGQQVRMYIEKIPEPSVDDMLDLAAQVYSGLSDEDIDEIEEIALNRKHFFKNRTR